MDSDRARYLIEEQLHELISVPPPKPAPAQLSSFRPSQHNVSRDDDNCLEVTLHNDETVTVVGEYELTVTSGVATVYGTVLRASSGEQYIYAPSTQALPQIQARLDGTSIRLSSANSGIRKLGKLSPLFRNIWALEPKGRSFALLGSTADDELQRTFSALEVDDNTDTVLHTLTVKSNVSKPPKPRIMAVGAKSSGKSTSNRLLCNKILSWTPIHKCYYLDIDPGQPEFGPPGIISLVEVAVPLLGPTFTHPASPLSPDHMVVYKHAIAASSFKDDPEHYKACVLDLAKHVDKRYPLIINSCGWVAGLGASVLADLAQDLDVSDIIVMEPVDSSLAESFQQCTPSVALHRIARRPPRPSARTPAEQRAMQTMAYFHSKHIAVEDAHLRWSGKPISRVRPWVVSYAGDTPDIIAVMSYGQNPTPEFLCEVLDGAIVAINEVDEEAALDLSERTDRTPEGLPFVASDHHGISPTLPPSQSNCLGLALVRGIDTENKQLHLVTPIPENHVENLAERKIVLVRGSFDPPEWAYLEDLYKDDVGPAQSERPWVSKKGLVGVEGAVWRLRHPPMVKDLVQGRR